jgi:aldose 1-epimerase
MLFGKTANGEIVEQFTLTNSQGTSIDILTLGATIRRFNIPLYKQEPRDIVLGFDSVEDYLNDQHYVGCVVGRYANRIHKGQFELDGRLYQVNTNQAGNCLHGGSRGFNRRIWCVENARTQSICLSLISPDGDQGFPGTLKVEVTYNLDNDNRLIINYQATSDRQTLFNPTQHSYFNLDGHNKGSIEQHYLALESEHILDVDKNGIPNGRLIPTKESAFDFNQPKVVGKAITANNPLLAQAKGLDHNWCLTKPSTNKISARLVSTAQDLELQVSTSMPGIQIYSGNFLPDAYQGKGGAIYTQHQGICLETQFYPDSPNQKAFSTPIVREGESFKSETCYKVIAHQ